MSRQLKDFSRAQLYKIAFLYATTDHDCSYRYFEKEYQISPSTFYSILRKAVVENIVPDSIVEKMANKSAYNSFLKAGVPARQRSEKYYRMLRLKRKEYI